MSYILDALNKSEEEKKQHRTPGLNTIHQKPANRGQVKRLWALIAGSVVILNLLGLIVWVVFLADTPTTDAKVDALPKTQSIIRQAPPENPALTQSKRAVSQDPGRSVSPTFANSSRERPSAQTDHLQAGLTRQITQEISAIRFSSHIFANDASLRMVVINGQALREGNRFGSGLLLKEITEEGVVVSHQKHEVPISVLSQWAEDQAFRSFTQHPV